MTCGPEICKTTEVAPGSDYDFEITIKSTVTMDAKALTQDAVQPKYRLRLGYYPTKKAWETAKAERPELYKVTGGKRPSPDAFEPITAISSSFEVR
jgi:hypothetical protein